MMAQKTHSGGGLNNFHGHTISDELMADIDTYRRRCDCGYPYYEIWLLDGGGAFFDLGMCRGKRLMSGFFGMGAGELLRHTGTGGTVIAARGRGFEFLLLRTKRQCILATW